MNTNEPTIEGAPSPVRIFVYKNKEQLGPMTIEEVLVKEKEGIFAGTDNAWARGEPGWVSLNTLLRKFAPPPPPATLPPPPPIESEKPKLTAKSRIFVRRKGTDFGPYSPEHIREFLSSGYVHYDDEVRLEETGEWISLSALLASAQPMGTSSLLATHFESSYRKKSNPFSGKWLAFTITSGVGILLLFVASALLGSRRYSYEEAGEIFAFFAFATLFAGFVISAFLLHALWSVVYHKNSPTTPGQAAGLMFVPLFNLFWQFVAIRGLAEELNRVGAVYAPSSPPVSVGLATTVCVFGCLAVLQFLLGPIFTIAQVGTAIFVWKSFANKATAILEAKRSQLAGT